LAYPPAVVSPAPNLSGFRRASVADQAAVALRGTIQQGVWSQWLPSEHELSRRLGVG
jgi:DNA-binding FadR family transcriptional regulator